MGRAREVGFLLVGPGGPVRWAPRGVADRVAVGSTPAVPAARRAFAPAELEARLEAHARRVAAEEAAAGEPRDAAGALLPRCWCCGAYRDPAGRPPEGWRFAGWRSRRVPGIPKGVEVYCPPCFARWGWPDAASGGSIS